MSNMIHEETKMYYIVTVNGVQVSPMFESKAVADMEKSRLPEDQRELAEVVIVTKQGQQLLLG